MCVKHVQIHIQNRSTDIYNLIQIYRSVGRALRIELLFDNNLPRSGKRFMLFSKEIYNPKSGAAIKPQRCVTGDVEFGIQAGGIDKSMAFVMIDPHAG